MEKEEEATSFTLETVDKSWAGLSEWVPGQVVMFIKCIYIYYKFNIYYYIRDPSPYIPKSCFKWCLLPSISLSCTNLATASLTSGRTPAPGASKEDDGVSVSEEEADKNESDKVFKQLGFPQIESSKFNPADFPKVAKCINKRVTKLGGIEKLLGAISTPTPQQSALLDQNL